MPTRADRYFETEEEFTKTVVVHPSNSSESIDGPTPNGGVRSVIYYQAADGSPVSKSKAVRVEVLEFDADDNEVGRTYAKV